MKVTNISHKIIGIGELALLPDTTDTIPAEFEHNPIVSFLIERGSLRLEKEEAAEPEMPVPPELTPEEVAAAELKEKVKAISKLNRAELDAACSESGIEVSETDTVPVLREKLIARLEA